MMYFNQTLFYDQPGHGGNTHVKESNTPVHKKGKLLCTYTVVPDIFI